MRHIIIIDAFRLLVELFIDTQKKYAKKTIWNKYLIIKPQKNAYLYGIFVTTVIESDSYIGQSHTIGFYGLWEDAIAMSTYSS